jgi:predicted DCC family thiol-disulfide oxidoreductase YuxK
MEPAVIEAKNAIILFDGTCSFCSGALRALAGVVW